MPPRKDYGPPTRKSHRRTAESEEPSDKATDKTTTVATPREVDPNEEVADVPETTGQTTLVQSIKEENAEDSEPENDEATPELPEPETNRTPSQVSSMMASGSGSQDNQLNALLDRIAQLEARAALMEDTDNVDRRTRAVTPMNSAFGGADFKPTGFAALPAFKPYGNDQDALNPNYDRKARKSGVDPGIFKGDKDEFDKWIIKVADKFEEDNETFKRERSRMAILNSLTESNANDLIEGRYRSTEIPFKNVAEMVATLTAVYHDDNQGSKARDELRKLKYNPNDNTTDIHQFIGKVNSLADKANIAKSDRKTVLYEHVPANLNPQLLGDSKDPLISYEAFAGKVADSALAQQRAYEERREKRQERHDRDTPVGRRSPRHAERRHGKKEAKVVEDHGGKPRPAEQTQEELKRTGRCFLCKEEGHIARDCPQRKAIAAVLAATEDEDCGSQSQNSSSTSDSEN